MCSTSGSSEEIIRIATPSAASSVSSRCTSALVAMSMPRVGSSTISSAGWRPSHLASTTFCWLPPDSWDTGSMSRPYLRLQPDRPVGRERPFRRRPDQAALAQPAERGERHVLLHRHVHDQALLPAVLGDEADARGHRAGRRGLGAAAGRASAPRPRRSGRCRTRPGPPRCGRTRPGRPARRSRPPGPRSEMSVNTPSRVSRSTTQDAVAGLGARARRRVPPPGGRPSRAPGHRRSARPARWSARAGRRASR